jgi:hypothetical protein
MWREMTAIVVLALMTLILLWVATGAERVSGSLTTEREEFLRRRIVYLEAQVRMERASCAYDRATCTAERMARRLGLEVAP